MFGSSRIARTTIIASPFLGILLVLGACAGSTAATPAAIPAPVAATPVVTPETAASVSTNNNLAGVNNIVPPSPAVDPPAAPAPVPASAPAPTQGESLFIAGNLKITPDEVIEGDNVTVSLTLTNTGKQRATHKLEVKFGDDTVMTREVTLDGGASENVEIIVEAKMPGVYKVTVDQLIGKLTVDCI